MSEEAVRKAERGLTLGREGYVSGLAWATVDASVRRLLDETAKNQGLASRERTEARVHEDLRAIREGIEGPSPTPLERLLAERVVVCYAALASMECTSDHHPVGASEGAWRRTERLHRRLNEAARALAAVQRMRLPASSVFVGGQHVHVGTESEMEAKR